MKKFFVIFIVLLFSTSANVYAELGFRGKHGSVGNHKTSGIKGKHDSVSKLKTDSIKVDQSVEAEEPLTGPLEIEFESFKAPNQVALEEKSETKTLKNQILKRQEEFGEN